MNVGDLIRFVKASGEQNSFFIRDIIGNLLYGRHGMWCHRDEVIEVNHVPATPSTKQIPTTGRVGGRWV